MRFFASLFILLVAGVAASAATLTPEQAWARASQQMQHTPAMRKSSAVEKPRLVHTVETPNHMPALYVYSTESGFAIVGADDVASPVIGYGHDTAFDPNNIPPAMQAMFAEYAGEIECAAKAPERVRHAEQVRPQRAPIAQLMSTKWNQDAPYNLLCPKIEGTLPPLGCTATALSQVVAYHKHPAKKGIGEVGYIWDSRTLSFDFESTEFRWDNMLDEYTTSVADLNLPANSAVATLCYAVAVCSNMDFGISGSGALVSTGIKNMIEHMGYDINAYAVARNTTPIIEFEELIYNSLAEGLPVPLSGYTANIDGYAAGHAFVTDGYDGNGYYHINWGWGGMSDGYFLLSALNPAEQGLGGSIDGFSYGLNAYIGVKPAQSDEFKGYHVCSDGLVPVTRSIVSGKSATLKAWTIINMSMVNLPAAYYGVKVTDGDGNSTYQPLIAGGELDPGYYFYDVEMDYTPPTDLPQGTYVLTLAYSLDRGETWLDVDMPISGSNKVIMTKTALGTLFVPASQVNPRVTDIDMASNLINGYKYDVKITVENPSSTEPVLINIFPMVTPQDGGDAMSAGNYYALDLLPGETKQISYSGTMPDYTGECYFAFYALTDDRGVVKISADKSITLMAKQSAVITLLPDFKLTAVIPPGSTSGTVTFEGDIYTESGACDYWICLSAATSGAAGYRSDGAYGYYSFVQGTTTHVTLSVNFSDVQPGDFAGVIPLYYSDKNQYEMLWEQINTEFVEGDAGVNDVTADPSRIVSTQYYNLQGVPLQGDSRSLAPGIYIRVDTRDNGSRTSSRQFIK